VWWYIPVIPENQEVEIRRMAVQGQPQQKISEIPFQQTNWEWWYTSLIPAMQG
jgi:hypothetical protein